ncbi:MAG TPA: DUF885 domain-containing protein, partial [Gemmatimonadales bacterium]|nr:DUF885 domain-containing protein [Gemmatimonadales bacterium]
FAEFTLGEARAQGDSWEERYLKLALKEACTGLANLTTAGLALSLLACAGGASRSASPTSSAPDEQAQRLDALADDYFRSRVQTYPVTALFEGVPDAPLDRLDPNAPADIRRWRAKEDHWLADLRSIRAEALADRPEEATYGVLRETLEASHGTRVCHPELLALDQQNGWQITLPVVAQLQPLGTPDRRAAALARWRAIPGYLDTEIGNLREGIRTGFVQPRGNAQAVLEQVDAILRFPVAQSPLSSLADRDSTPGFRDSVYAVVEHEVVPAVRRYREFLATDYLPHARATTALSSLPHGVECYRARVRASTTRDLDPAALAQLGRDQMAAIEAEMRPLAERLFHTTDFPTLFDRLRSDSALMFHSRDEIIRTAESAVARAKAAMPRWFGRLPRSDVIVDPCLPFEEKSGCPNSYVSGTPDGSRPGRWRINAGVNPPQLKPPLEGTAFHETIPGHHLQGAIAQERPGAHPLTRYLFFSGFGEGWALYAERLADTMGLYSSDLYRFGELDEQALRAARLVVDPGLAVLGWTRQQAIDYMLSHLMYDRQTIESEVDRYIANPGQATSYMVGRLEIERLRKEAETRLGSRFDIRQFHDRVLESGNIPLPVLSAHIERWLDQLHRP